MSLFIICAYPGCHRPVSIGDRYCVAHLGKGAEQDKAREERRRRASGTASERGYTYKWSKVAKAFLAKHPLCAECERDGRVTAATSVDHIIPHKGNMELFWDKSNWQALCHSCHSRKTAREYGGFGNGEG